VKGAKIRVVEGVKISVVAFFLRTCEFDLIEEFNVKLSIQIQWFGLSTVSW